MSIFSLISYVSRQQEEGKSSYCDMTDNYDNSEDEEAEIACKEVAPKENQSEI